MIEVLQRYHPLVIEGMGGYDTRDPSTVALHLVAQLQAYWQRSPPSKPLLLITQGDPLEERGISAITRLVADRLDIPRGLVFLDPDIAAYHAPNADRYKVCLEISYSELATRLETRRAGLVPRLEATVDTHLAEKNRQRIGEGGASLADYYRDFALLQEVTKAACMEICGDITIGHTSSDISNFSVSSFYAVGLELGLIDPAKMVPYAEYKMPSSN